MEIGKFKLAKADLVRPPNKPAQEQIIPKQKPYTEKVFKLEVDDFIKGFIGGFPKDEMLLKIQSVLDKAVDAGAIEPQEGIKYLRERKQQLVDFARENYGQQLPGIEEDRNNFAIGGGVIEGEDLGTREGFNRPRIDAPGLEDEVKKLFNEGLSTNQVLENLKQKPEFEKVSEGVVKRIKKEFNLGVKRADVLTSQANKYNKLKELVEQSNNQLKFVEMQTLRERVGLPKKTAPTDPANIEKFNVPKLDSAADKVRKGFFKIINNPDIPVEEVFDITSKIVRDTNLANASVSKFLQDIPEYQDFKPVALKLQSPAFKAKIVNKNKTLSDVMEMADQIPVSGITLSGVNTPERFIINSVKRHINQGGDKVQWVKAPGTIDKQGNLITEADSVFRYNGKDYNYYDLVANGRNMKEFKEVYKSYDDLNDLLSREVTDPSTNSKITFKELMQKAYSKGANFSSSSNPYEIDHFGSVKNEPFSNLRILPYRINRVQGALQNKSSQAKAGFLKPEVAKMYTDEKVKNYLQKSGYNFTKDINKIFQDEIKLANDILTKNRVLKTPIQIGKDIEEQKFTKLLDIPGVKRASEIDRPESAIRSDMFKAVNERLAKIKNIPLNEVEQDVSKVTKLLNETSGTINSGADPVFLAKYLKAQGEDIAAFGKKYGGDALSKIIKGTAALDVPIMQVAFASMQDWEEDSPLWVTLPAAFTDEVANAFNLYNKTGGKAKEFGKFLASSFIPRAARSPLFKAVSKVGKGASLATPILELGQEAYKFEKQKRMLPEIARQFDIPIEEARKGFENYIRSTIPEDPAGQGLDELNVPESPGLEGLKRSFKEFGSLFGFTESPYKDPNAKEEIITPIAEPKTASQQFLAVGGRVGFADGPENSKKGLGSFSKRNFLKTLALIPAGIMAIRGGPNLLKKAKPAIEAAKGMPDWFGGLVDKVIETGTDITKQFAKQKGEQVFVKQIGEAEGVRVTKNLETGKIKVDYDSPTNMGEDTVTFTYIPGTKTKKGENIPAQFEVSELEPRGIRMSPDDYEIEFDGEHLVEDINFLESDTSSLKQFATGKLDEKDLKLRQEKVKRVKNINNDQTAQAEYLETKYGPSSDDANDYDLNYQDYSDYD